MTIFEISKELQEIYDTLEENGGELTEELENQLAITQEDFKDKVKSYTEVIKSVESEINLIDEEVARLKKLKESKDKAIERLKKIIIWAIDNYGDTTKSGGKYVDYGTGKISVRNTEKVEVNTDLTDNIVNEFFNYIRFYAFSKELNYIDAIDGKEVLDNLKQSGINITEDELNNLTTSISFDINIKDLLTSKGLGVIKAIHDNTNCYKTKSNMSKTTLKTILKEGTSDLHNIAELINNKTISIK